MYMKSVAERRKEKKSVFYTKSDSNWPESMCGKDIWKFRIKASKYYIFFSKKSIPGRPGRLCNYNIPQLPVPDQKKYVKIIAKI